MAALNAPKRTLRDIWPHLVVSACALLLPPLGMAAGVVYLGSPHPHEIAASSPAEHAAVAVAAEPTKAHDPGPAVASSSVANPSVANAVPSPAEQRPAPEPQVAAAPAPRPVAAPAPASTNDAKDTASKDAAGTKDVAAAKDVATKDAAPAAAPPAIAKIGETSERTARAEASPPAENADAPAAPAVNAQHSGQKSRHESRGGRIRQARVPSITDIFLHPIRTR
jgi:hypothetical protein